MDRCFLGLFQKYSDKHFETFRRIHDYGNSWGILDLHFRVDQKMVQSRKWSNSTCESHVSQHWIWCCQDDLLTEVTPRLGWESLCGGSFCAGLNNHCPQQASAGCLFGNCWINNLLLIWVDPSSILLKNHIFPSFFQDLKIQVPFCWRKHHLFPSFFSNASLPLGISGGFGLWDEFDERFPGAVGASQAKNPWGSKILGQKSCRVKIDVKCKDTMNPMNQLNQKLGFFVVLVRPQVVDGGFFFDVWLLWPVP